MAPDYLSNRLVPGIASNQIHHDRVNAASLVPPTAASFISGKCYRMIHFLDLVGICPFFPQSKLAN
jgi:hypothetical protein